jgi:hypothetical protein
MAEKLADAVGLTTPLRRILRRKERKGDPLGPPFRIAFYASVV